MTFTGDVLARICVPLFFVISGYLFFLNTSFNKESYIKKLKSRVRTLLVPYLIWNFFGFLDLLTKLHPNFLVFYPSLANYKVDIVEFIKCFWVAGLPSSSDTSLLMAANPINGPLWFIRDLMIMVLLSPVIYYMIKKFKIFAIILLAIVWLFSIGNKCGIPENSFQSLFFFPLGAYLSVNKYKIDFLSNKFLVCILLYLPFAIADTFTKNLYYNVYIHKIGIIVGIAMVLSVAATMVKKSYLRSSQFLSSSSFFIFAYHALFIGKFIKFLEMIIKPESTLMSILLYLFMVVVTVGIGLLLYYCLNRYIPAVSNILTGGRQKN